jgi:hypothetical protein
VNAKLRRGSFTGAEIARADYRLTALQNDRALFSEHR